MSGGSTIPTPASPDVCSVVVLVDGTAISGEFHVLSVTVDHELNRIPRATLELRDGDPARATFPAGDTDHFVPGRKIEIRLGYRATVDPVFKGVVVAQRVKIRKNVSALVVECRDEAVRMTRGLNNRYFADATDSDVIEELLDRHRLQKDVQSTNATFEEVVQYQATDWDFLVCRAQANGHVVRVQDGKVTVAAPSTAGSAVVSTRFGATVLELDAELDARTQIPGLAATCWSPTDQNVTEAEAAEPSVTTGGNLSADDLSAVLGGDPSRICHGGHLSEPELQAWADGRLLADRLARVRGRVRFQGFAGVTPGKLIDALGIGKRFEGVQYVSGVRHAVVHGNWETDVQFGLDPALFAAIYPVSAPPAAGLLPSVSGIQLGVVTALEGDPEGEDRIRVRLPLISASADGTWARIATLDAGNERGTFFRPEISDEVVVGFLDGDPRFPIVLGMCHSSAKPAPEPPEDDNHHKGYVSRSKMRLIFDDDKKSVLLETPAGNTFSISEDESKISLVDQSGNKITLDSAGVTVDSARDLILKAAGDVKVSGTNVELTASASFKAAGSASAELTAASTKVNGDATTVIKGGIVQIN